MKYRVIGPDDPHYPAVRKRLLVTWIKTILGYLMMGGLVLAALKGFGASYHFQLGWGILWIFLPVVMWWYSAKIALAMNKATPADPNNPAHKRLIDLVDRVYAESGLKFKPPVYVADNDMPNAFATGPIHRRAVVAATKGLFECGMTDEEIIAVFAHELGHVKNYDVAINSFLGIISSLFFLIVDGGVRMLMGSIGIFKKVLGIRKTGFIGSFLSLIVLYVVFQITGQITKLVQLFVVRSRESAADATAALITGCPCDLSTALQKLVAYVEKHRPKGREKEFWRAWRPIMIVDPIFDAIEPDPKPQGLFELLKSWWKALQLTHPTVSDRIVSLEKMNGGKCPRI